MRYNLMSKDLLKRLNDLQEEKSADLRRQRLMQENKDRAMQLLLGIKLTMKSSGSNLVQYK